MTARAGSCRRNSAPVARELLVLSGVVRNLSIPTPTQLFCIGNEALARDHDRRRHIVSEKAASAKARGGRRSSTSTSEPFRSAVIPLARPNRAYPACYRHGRLSAVP